jgi:periplasmic protein TonB
MDRISSSYSTLSVRISRIAGIVRVSSGSVAFAWDGEMKFRLHPGFPAFFLAVFSACAAGAQSGAPAQSSASTAAPSSPQKIVTKDPVYLKLLDPPKDAAYFQTFSQSYRDAFAEINSKFMDITDTAARDQARKEEWEKALKENGDKFQYEADLNFHDAKLSYAHDHRDAWLVIGPVYYDTTNSVLRAKNYPNAPIVANVRVPMTPADLQNLYAKYHSLFADEIDRKTHEYVAKAGAGSNCARLPDLCYKYSYQDIEEKMRTDRLVAVAQGDLEAGRVDRLFLADYDTETTVLDLGATSSEISGIGWRFSPGPLPAKPAEPAPVGVESATTTNTPAAAPTAAPAATPAGTATSAGQGAQPDSGKSTAGPTAAAGSAPAEAAPTAAPTATPAPAKPSAPPVVVPANLTAASIVTRTAPAYPPEARAKLIEGEVLLRAIIDKEGKISEVHVLSGDDLLAQAAVNAVRQWRYKPMLVDGEAREVDTTITVTFSLKN